jgi:hypothetical protein
MVSPPVTVEVATPDTSIYSPTLKWPVEVAELLIRKVESKVDEARTKMPADVEVGVKVSEANPADSQEPGAPDPPPQPEQESTVRAPLTVRAPPTVTAPLKREVPKTENVVEAEAVPIPT